MNRDAVIAALRQYRPRTVSPKSGRRAAVLVPLRPSADPTGLEVILTRRADDLGSHAGQVSFPGGAIDPEDPHPEAAALREAHEELGIPPAAVEVIGRLDEMYTVTSYHVVPVVGVVDPDVELVPSPREVARVFAVPLSQLLEPGRWLSQLHPWRGKEYQVWHFGFDGEDVWGATGRMLRDMIELLWKAGEGR